MPKIKVNDISMYYELHGKGNPIVCISGFSADHTIWKDIVDRFKNKYQLILFDNRGAGQTDIPDGPYTITQMANDVAGLCAKLEIPQAHFIGNSMGGFILQDLALHHPDLVKSAIISHSSTNIHSTFHFYVKAQLELLKNSAPIESIVKAACSWVYSYQFLTQPNMLDYLIQLSLNNPCPFTVKGYEGQFVALETFNSDAWANQIRTPTLVLASNQDLIFSEEMVKKLIKLIPKSEYYCFHDCGHLPQIEYPDLFSKIVQHFVDKQC